MTSPPRICVVGSANVDLTFRTTRLPREGETLAGQAFHLGYGGKGANQAVMAARLGAAVSLIAGVGDDAFGRESIQHYQAMGLDTKYIQVDGGRSTGVAGIIVDDQARNCILVVPGANHGLSPGDVRAAAGAIEAAEVLLCQLEVPLKTTLEALRVARAAGVRTILNPAPALPLPEEILQLADVCVPNESEIEILSGLPATNSAEAETAARQWQRKGVRTVIVTLGQRGLLILDDNGVYPIAAVPVTAVDPTGAGDAFIGALAVFWSEGLNLREAAAKASAVAALTVTRPGTQVAFPTRVEAEAWCALQAARP